MQKLIMYGIIGGLAYWIFFRPKAIVPPTQQTRLTTEPQPPQMSISPGISGPELYNVEAFPMGAFAN